ncbi:MAG: hypothetical protein APR54_12180, partial [Candidatus Cloacimonas sp. SDB]
SRRWKKCREETEQDQGVKDQELVEDWEEGIFLQGDLLREQDLEENVYVLPVEQFKLINPDNHVLR